MAELLQPWPQAHELPALRARVLQEPNLVGNVIKASGTHSAVIVRAPALPQSDITQLYGAIKRLARAASGPEFEVVIAGVPALETELYRLLDADAAVLFSFSTVVITLVLLLTFRRPLRVLGPLLVILQAVAVTFGAMAMADVPITPVTNILSSLLICVGIGDAVHVQSCYRSARRRGADIEAALGYALASAGWAVVATSLTTMAGLLSFLTAALGSIRDLGLFGALGVLLMLVYSIGFLPLVLSFERKTEAIVPDGRAAYDLLDRFLALSSRIATHRATLPVALLLALGAGAGLARLRVEHNALTWLPPRLELKAAFEDVDKHLGGSAELHLIIRPLQGSIAAAALMRGLQRLEAHLRSYRDPRDGTAVVAHVDSLLDVLRESARAVRGGAPEHYRVPDDTRGITDLLTLFQASDPEDYRRLATIDSTATLMTVRVKWVEATRYISLREHVEKGVRQFLGEQAQVKLSGSVYISHAIVVSLIEDMIRSVSTALLVITLILMTVLRSVRLGLLAMVPNLLPMLGLFGLMGALDWPLDMTNVLVASIAIGIAVDDTIHFLHHAGELLKRGHPVQEAIDHAFEQTGRALVTTSIVLCCGFGVFLGGQMANAQHFGALVAASVVLALLADLWVCPAVLRLAYRSRTAVGALGEGASPDRYGYPR